MSRRYLRRLAFAAIGLLYILSVPWYRSDDDAVAIVLGLPDWVAVALACYVTIAVLNGVAWWLGDVSDSLDDSKTPES